MLRIEKLPFGASNCAVLPYQAKDAEGFIDTGNDLLGIDPHVYISGAAVKEMAKLFGWFPPDTVADLEQRLAACEKELDDTLEQLSDADGYLDAIDTLESQGFRARKKPGRPKTTQTEKAA